jgi:hypothetical protein
MHNIGASVKCVVEQLFGRSIQVYLRLIARQINIHWILKGGWTAESRTDRVES